MKTRLSLLLVVAAIVAVCGLTATCFAQKIAYIVDTRPIYQEAFKDTLDNIIWCDTVITLADAIKLGTQGLAGVKVPRVKVLYPKVVFVNEKRKYGSGANEDVVKSIRFLDIKGRILFELKEKPYEINFGNINISKNKRYICITTWTKKKFITKVRNSDTGVIEDCEEPLFESRIYNTDGILLRTIKQSNSYVYVSPNGEYVVGSGAFEDYGDITMYNEKGFITGIERNGGSWHIDFSDDGSWFIVIKEMFDNKIFMHAKTNGERSISRPIDLIAFDKKGNEVWRKEKFIYDTPFTLKVDEKNLIIIMTGYGDYNKYIYNYKGELIIKQKIDRKQYINFYRSVDLNNNRCNPF